MCEREHILCLQAVLTGQQPLDASCEELLLTKNKTKTKNIQVVLTGQQPLDASCEEPLLTTRLHAVMMGEEAVSTVTDSSGNRSSKTKKFLYIVALHGTNTRSRLERILTFENLFLP